MSATGLESKLVNTNVRPALKSCCAQHLQAVVGQPETGAVIKANFASLLENAVEFDVRAQANVVVELLKPTVISYVQDGVLYVFVSAITEFLPSATAGKLIVTLPYFLIQPELRRHFRVPSVDAGRVQITMEDEGYGVYEPELVDLSVGGMLIEFPVGQDPNIESNAAMKVQLKLDEHVANYLAEVRHSRPGRYGLMFIESPDPVDAVQEADTLRSILGALEQAWLSH